MVSYFTRLAALAAVIPAIFAAPSPAAHHLKIRNPEAVDVVPDSYIVVYHSNVNASMIASHVESVDSMLSRRDLTGIGATYDMDLLKGYQVTADPATLAEIAASPEVNLQVHLLNSSDNIRLHTLRRMPKSTLRP